MQLAMLQRLQILSQQQFSMVCYVSNNNKCMLIVPIMRNNSVHSTVYDLPNRRRRLPPSVFSFIPVKAAKEKRTNKYLSERKWSKDNADFGANKRKHKTAEKVFFRKSLKMWPKVARQADEKEIFYLQKDKVLLQLKYFCRSIVGTFDVKLKFTKKLNSSNYPQTGLSF